MGPSAAATAIRKPTIAVVAIPVTVVRIGNVAANPRFEMLAVIACTLAAISPRVHAASTAVARIATGLNPSSAAVTFASTVTTAVRGGSNTFTAVAKTPPITPAIVLNAGVSACKAGPRPSARAARNGNRAAPKSSCMLPIITDKRPVAVAVAVATPPTCDSTSAMMSFCASSMLFDATSAAT